MYLSVASLRRQLREDYCYRTAQCYVKLSDLRDLSTDSTIPNDEITDPFGTTSDMDTYMGELSSNHTGILAFTGNINLSVAPLPSEWL